MKTPLIRIAQSVSLLLIGLVLAGCPRGPQSAEFTSANAGNYRGALDGPQVPTDAAGGEGTGGGDTPRTVVEPDVIRRAGNLLYVLNQFRGLSIVDLDTNALLAQVPTLGFPRDLYLVGDRAYVLTAWGTNYVVEGDQLNVSFDLRSRVQVVDVSVPAAAAITGEFQLEGDLIDSRLVGDVLYAVTANYQWYATGDGGTTATSPATVEKQQTSNSRVVSIAVGDPTHIAQVDSEEVPGYGNLIQATPEAIYVASYDWNTNSGATNIQYIDISDPAGTIVPRGVVSVPGYLADRFKMDEYNGVLRVVSNTWWPDRQIYVTTADVSTPDAITKLGQTTISDENANSLFATRFDGPRAYVVTYFMVDPLHVIDLSDPANPRQVGELEVPGWSTYIEPQGDRLIALGVDDTNGQRRVSVSLFDVADPAAPALLDRESFGESWSWSNAFYDVKAFTVLDDTLIVPFGGWSETAGGYERLQFLSYSRDALDLRGYVDLQGGILRSLQYGDGFYGVTSEQVAAITGSDLDHLAVTDKVVLAENIADVHELSPGVVAEVITRYDTADLVVRTVDAGDNVLGEVSLKNAGFQQTFLQGDALVLLSIAWDPVAYVSRYHVSTVRCTDPAAPKLESDFDVPVNPYWGGWWYDGYGGPVAEGAGVPGATDGAAGGGGGAAGPPISGHGGASGAKQVADIGWWGPWWWWTPQDTAWLSGNRLIARCFSDTWDVVSGSGTPYQGLVVVDLSTQAIKKIGLAYDDVRAVDVIDGTVYLGTKKYLGQDLLGRGTCAFYVSTLDPVSGVSGPLANVPGEYIHYDPASDLLLLRDYQYDFTTYNLTRSLHSVRWSGGATVEPLDALDLDSNMGSTMIVRGNRIFHDTYDNGFGVATIDVAADGTFSAGKGIGVTNQWGYLLGASDASAYVVVGGSVVARYDFSGTPQLGETVNVMGTPSRVRLGDATAYLPLGYSGLAELPL